MAARGKAYFGTSERMEEKRDFHKVKEFVDILHQRFGVTVQIDDFF